MPWARSRHGRTGRGPGTVARVTSDLDLRERHELCDRFDALGPDAPTLCEGWTTADLAAHLVVREREPIGASGILIPALEGFTAKRMARELERHGYAGTVERVRTGPPFPMKIPPVRHAVNLVEYFVHHEDVRRANGDGPRTDRGDLDDELWGLIGRTLRLMLLRARPGVKLVVARPGGDEHAAGRGPAVRMTGTPGELILDLYGRKGVAEITWSGPDDAVAKVRDVTFGL
jgi:uncharacterized protein (TIGR03085 family)